MSAAPIWLNGALSKSDSAISAEDRGLLLGESLFETILLANGIPQFWAAHIKRLRNAAAHYQLPFTYDDKILRQAVGDLLAAQETTRRMVLRLTLTGGAGGRGLVPQTAAKANLIIQLSPAADVPESLLLADSAVLRLAGQSGGTHKTGAYLDNILARKQAMAAGADEAVLLNQHGRVACAAAGNVFAAFGTRLITPPLSEGALDGILRHAVLTADKPAGYQAVEGLIEADMLRQADAIFVSNSLNGMVAAGYDAVSAAQKKQGLAINEALPHFTEF